MIDALESTFGQEWENLTPYQKLLVMDDFALAVFSYEYGIKSPPYEYVARKYRQLIGPGNLMAYSEVMEAKRRKQTLQLSLPWDGY